MTTIITALDAHRLSVITETVTGGAASYICPASDFNRKHCGTWNSRVVCFVGPPSPTFSDGTPVSHYDDIYEVNDHSGIYHEECVVCGVATRGNRYCGTSCAEKDQEEQ